MKNRIQVLIMDVDGTLTDGKIYMSDAGELFKSFDVKDGYAIKHILPTLKILPVIITGRHSLLVEKRAQEIGIQYIYQGVIDKEILLPVICEKFNVQLENIAYIGDDLNDFNVMKLVGCVACPCDAAAQIKKIAQFVCMKNGGNGAVREFIEWLNDNRDAL